MAIVNEITAAPDALKIIADAPYDFYLGGSRRMMQLSTIHVNGTPCYSEQSLVRIGPDTDYDFYVTYTEEISQYLFAYGFKETLRSLHPHVRDIDLLLMTADDKLGEYDCDSEVVRIMWKDNVQVVLRKDAEFYCTVFENIPVAFYYQYLWKSAPHAPDRSAIMPIFNALFAVAHAAQRYRINF